MLILFLAGALAGPVEGAAAWTPPAQVEAHGVLHEARRDAREGKHEIALAKFLWFHRNALKHRRSLAAVRLSFALSYWMDLARRYPPALEALKKTRDDALAHFNDDRRGRAAFHAFHEFESINAQLGDESLTARVFEEVDSEDPRAAVRLYRVAQPALIVAKKYALCAKYLRAGEDWPSVSLLYQMGRREARRYGLQRTDYAGKAFTNRVATLVALLVVNGRQPEAEYLARRARLEWEDAGFQAAIQSALRGQVPEPWP